MIKRLVNQKLSYCGELVREQDKDRFLLSMFAPPGTREDLWALFAFNHEIAKTREVVTEMQLGLIRLQWWREEIGKIYDTGQASEHEVLKALARAIQARDLPRAHFETLIYAREFDLEDVLPSTMEGLLNYADFTATPLLKLAVQIAGDDPEMEPVAPVAINYALAGILRALPFHAGQRRCYLPESALQNYGIKLEALYELKPPAGLPGAVQEVAAQVVGDIRPQSRFLKASDTLAKIYIKHIKLLKYNVFSPKMAAPPFLKEIRLLAGVKCL